MSAFTKQIIDAETICVTDRNCDSNGTDYDLLDDVEFRLPTVAVAESVTAGALSTALCSECGASDYFKGAVITYNPASKKHILQIDTDYSEKIGHDNPATTLEMAKKVTVMFDARIGIATTGYRLPIQGICDKPRATIVLYDKKLDISETIFISPTFEDINKKMWRARAQVTFALAGRKLYTDYCAKISF